MIVICHKMGQLGNRLFLFAHMIAAAAETQFICLVSRIC